MSPLPWYPTLADLERDLERFLTSLSACLPVDCDLDRDLYSLSCDSDFFFSTDPLSLSESFLLLLFWGDLDVDLCRLGDLDLKKKKNKQPFLMTVN